MMHALHVAVEAFECAQRLYPVYLVLASRSRNCVARDALTSELFYESRLLYS